MVISDEQQYKGFLTECTNSDCIFFTITNSNNIHAAVSEPILLFIKNVNLDKIYILNIKHYDFDYKIDKELIIKDLAQLNCNKFAIEKKKFIHSFPISNVKDLQLVDFIKYGKLQETRVIPDSYNFFYNKFPNKKNINQIIPSSIHLQLFKNSCELYEENVEDFQYDESYDNINTHIIENLQKIESNGIYVNTDLFYNYFPNSKIVPIENKVYTSYNIYTSTGRPSNAFGGVNYAALKKDNGCRSTFISRYGQDGMLMLIDYSAYHPHIVAKLINYDLPADAYNYLGKYYYGRDVLSDEELKDAKNITFQCMYGNIPDELLVIPYFKKMSEYINHRWEFFIKNEYVETPIYKRRITTDHIYEPNPNKLFNYILQASETEFGMAAIENINNYLENKKTKVILYTYDSLLFDIHKDDGRDTITDIKSIMSQRGFPVKCDIGHDYDNMKRVNI